MAFIIKIYCDAQSSECQIGFQCFEGMQYFHVERSSRRRHFFRQNIRNHLSSNATSQPWRNELSELYFSFSYYSASFLLAVIHFLCFLWFTHTHYETFHKQITNRQEHQTRTDDIHMRPHTVQLYTLNEHKSAGGIVTAQNTAEGPLKMVERKDRKPKHVGVLYLQTRF